MTSTIYVRLLNEDVAVWRPVSASQVGGEQFRIDEQAYDAELELWEFTPGEIVIAQGRTIDGQTVLVASRKAER